MKKTSCVILNYNDSDNVIKLCNVIKDYNCFTDIVVVDNCSSDNSLVKLNRILSSKIHLVVSEKNGGYGLGNNLGMKYAFEVLNNDYVVICNPDVFFEEELINRFVCELENNHEVGCISAIQKDINGNKVLRSAWKLPAKWQYIFSIGHFTSKFSKSIYYSQSELYATPKKEVGCIAGSLLCLSKDAFNKTRGYDENVFLYCEETILGYKLDSVKLKSIILTDCFYDHLHGVTINKTFKHMSERQKLLNKSHHYVVMNYLKSNAFDIFIDSVICNIRMLETKIVDIFQE